jgi:putative hydrolase of the HAD superfamily
MRSLPGFLFLDLDDTILDYTTPGERCWKELCTSFAPRAGTLSAEQLRDAIRRSGDWYWSDPDRFRLGRLDLKSARREVVAGAFKAMNVDNRELSEELADSFTTLREEMIQPFPGAVETLRALHDRGIRMGLITNGRSEFQRAKISRFELAQYFEFILIEGEFGAGKPDERVFQHGLEQFNISPGQVWMIGDDLEFDMRPAQGLGIGTVWVNHANETLPADGSILPTWTILSLADLIEK